MEFFYSHNERYFHVVRAIQCKNSGIIPIISLNPQVSCKYIMRCRSRCFPKKCSLPNAPQKMLSKKCSTKQNAPQNKMLPREKCSPSKCSLKKNAPQKICWTDHLPMKSGLGTLEHRLGQIRLRQVKLVLNLLTRVGLESIFFQGAF